MNDILRRKLDHIDLSLSEDVSMRLDAGFERLRFLHEALPELDLAEISLETTFLGHRLGAPFLISSMTGGPERGEAINRHLGEAAQALRLPLALGSQRVIFERPEALASFRAARAAAPDAPLFGNLGAVQLNYGFDAARCAEAVAAIAGQGLFLHLNPLQEAIQPGGDTNFRGLADRIGEVARAVDFPLLAKEVGCGIGPGTARRLVAAGVAAIDVSGAGGTSWARIEAHRAAEASQRTLGEVFGDWGIPTATALRLCRRELPNTPLIASGGMRNGLEAAKAIALGADLVGLAMPLLEPATRSGEAVTATLEQFMAELRLAMFLVGARDLAALRARADMLVEVVG